MPSLSSIPRYKYLYVFPCSSSCISLLVSITKFCEWVSLPLLNVILVHFSSPNSILISLLKVLTVCICFWSSSSDLAISFKSSVKFLSLLCALHILCLTYSVVQWEESSKCKMAVVKVILLEIFHIVFLCLLFLLLLLSSSSSSSLTRGEGEEHLLMLQWLSPFKTACHHQYKHANDVNFWDGNNSVAIQCVPWNILFIHVHIIISWSSAVLNNL